MSVTSLDNADDDEGGRPDVEGEGEKDEDEDGEAVLVVVVAWLGECAEDDKDDCVGSGKQRKKEKE